MAIETRNQIRGWLTVGLVLTPLLLTPLRPASRNCDLIAARPADPTQQAFITLPRILPDPVPCAYRYEVVERSPFQPGAIRDTVEVILFRSIGEVVAAYGPLDDEYEKSVKQTARGEGWIVDELGGLKLWVETDQGLQVDKYYSYSHARGDTFCAGVVLPREVWVDRTWKSSFRESSRIAYIGEVDFQGNSHLGIEIISWSESGFADKESSALWIPGIGMVRKSSRWMGIEAEYVLLEVIPAGQPQHVRCLNLQAAREAGYLIPDLARFSGVRTLKTYLDTLKDAEIPLFNHFPQLRTLDLNGQPLTGITFHQLRLPDLQELLLAGSLIEDRYLKDLPNLTGLEVLDLRNTPVTDKGVENLIAAVNLRELRLGGRYRQWILMNVFPRSRDPNPSQLGSITDESCAILARLTGLQTLNLADTYITDAGIWNLRGLSGLRSLNLSHTRITDESLAVIAHLPALEELALTRTLVTDQGLWYLRNMKSLRNLSLIECAITDSGLAHLEGHPGLTKLFLTRCRISNRCIPSLMGMPQLEHLVAYSTAMTEDVRPILDGHTSLKSLRLTPERIGLFDLIREIPSLTMAHPSGSAPDADPEEVGSDRVPTYPFKILPDNPPLGYRYLLHHTSSGSVSRRDTLVSIVLNRLHDVPVQPSWPLHPDTLLSEPPVEIGSGWQLLDVFGNLTYWIETPTGLFSTFDVGGPDGQPAIGSLLVASHPDTNSSWALYYDAHVSIQDTSTVTALTRAWPGQRTKMEHRGEGAVREWALGLGLVSERYQPPHRYDHYEMTLVDTLGIEDADAIDRLCLKDIKVDDTGLASYTRFRGIRELILANARISDKALHVLADFPLLQSVDLSGCEITGGGFDRTPYLPALESLDLSGTRVNDATLRLLPNRDFLRALNLRNSYITDAGLRNLADATNLKALQLGNEISGYQSDQYPSDLGMTRGLMIPIRTFIRGEGLRHLADLGNLKVLDLSGTDIEDRYLVELLALTSLEELDLSHTMLTDQAIPVLAGLPNLRSLDLSRTKIGDGAIPGLASLTHLEELDLGGTSITDSTIAALAQLPCLRRLYLLEVVLTEKSRDVLITMDNLELLVLPLSPWKAEVRDALPNTQVYPIWP